MRIRRRPQAQAQALVPSLLHHPSDPSTAPPPPANQHHWLPGKEEANTLGELHRPNVDLGDEPSRPQGNNVVGGRSGSETAPGRGGGGAPRQAGSAAHGHGSLENGHRDEHDWRVIGAGEERLANGVMPVTSPTAAVHGKDGIKSDVPKRRRGPAVLLEGSRCSRVNGRGWRCSQPTLVGYSLCEHHLGKGRQSRSAASANGGGGRSASGTKLGRTEPASSRKAAAAAMAVVTVTAVPDASEPPTLRHIDLRSIDGTVQ
uniref:Uncharacterized protein n=1 Tax=Avena sativa TaxID=4498 RepID=A0ACD5ZAF5_AVESA